LIERSIESLAEYSVEQFHPVLLSRTERSKTMLVCFEPGQAIPVHRPNVDLTLLVLRGSAILVGGEDELTDAGPGAMLQVEAGQPRGIKAGDERTLALVVVSPPPSEADHAEVAKHLAAGTWR